MGQTIERKKWGQGFRYLDAQTRKTIVSKKLKSWIQSLAIPPAWTDVHIFAQQPRAKVFAWGRDVKGRKQYIYNPKWREKQEKKKFARIIDFASRLSHMRQVTGQHLAQPNLNRDKVMACMVRLMENAYFRPGSDYYTSQNQTYGLTTLRSKHLDVQGHKLTFSYKGKSGKTHTKKIKDRRLAEIVREIDEVPGYEIFKYFDSEGQKVDVKSDDLNRYIHEVMGEEYSAKDFRTWAGTFLAATLLNEMGVVESQKEQKTKIKEAINQVAQHLGNTEAVAKANYIDPRVVQQYEAGVTLQNYIEEVLKEIDQDNFTNKEEKALLKLLQSIQS
jgi:DNA topoisomerase-1